MKMRTGDEALTFRDKDLVVFLGDSITEDNAYAGILADWYLTRFPERDVRFVNSGVPGEVGGGAGILCPSNSTLIVTGQGTLLAEGGDGGAGGFHRG